MYPLWDVEVLRKSAYEVLSKSGSNKSSITWSSLFRLSMHILSSWSGGPNIPPKPAALFSRNSANCSLSTTRAFARAFQKSLPSTSSFSKSSLRALKQYSLKFSRWRFKTKKKVWKRVFSVNLMKWGNSFWTHYDLMNSSQLLQKQVISFRTTTP